MRRKFPRKRKAPVGDTDQGFVLKNLEGGTTFRLFMEGLFDHTREQRARNVVALRRQRLGKTHVWRACNRVVC
jgi:hypothetical protein